jgi:hypothetical protein
MIPPSQSLKFLPLSIFPLALAAAEPRQARWSSEAFGPDGPWNAVEVALGAQPSIALFPGRMWNTFVTTSDYCAFNNSVPHCASGTYLKDKAVAASRTGGPAQRIEYKQPTQEMATGVQASGTSNMFLETIDLQFDSGVVPIHSISLIEAQSQMFSYPDGTRYPIFTGCLSVGAPEPQQIFTGNGGRPSINASMIPWVLKDSGSTASSSFGMHYGSAAPAAKVPGSLLFGGYDRNRVVGNVLTLDGDFWTAFTLKDVSISVIQGSSPFSPTSASTSTTTIPNLLAQGNSTIPLAGLPVLLDPCSPYLTLPKSTCDAIASHLPVIYNGSLGLYLWNTTSPAHTPIVSSASALSFTFMGASNTDSLTIHLPFRHLNLTLSPPFTTSPVPYFPCFTGGTGAYVLGRTFFQDAFVGANWERKKIWLAQAPGPNIPATADAVNIQVGDVAIQGGGNDWEKSWEGFWRGLSEEEAAKGRDGVEEGDGGVGSSSSDSNGGVGGGSGGGNAGSSGGGQGAASTGLSTAAMAGIGVGAAVGGMVLVAAAGWCLCRRKKARLAADRAEKGFVAQPAAALNRTGEAVYQEHYGPGDVKHPDWADGPAEVPAEDHRVYEMPADHPGGPDGWAWPPR